MAALFFSSWIWLSLGSALTASVVTVQQEPKPAAAPAPNQGVPALFPAGYVNYDALTAALTRACQRHPANARMKSLGKSVEGRDVWLVSLGHEVGEGPGRRPAILVVANLEADHLVGSQIALGMVERFADSDQDSVIAALLDHIDIYVIPRLNPDGAERMLGGRPGVDQRLSAQPLDRDRDGKRGEDGPDDLDGDGLALTMRVNDLKSSLMADPDDPRHTRKPNATRGEKAQFSVYQEGRDDDGDGQINEDPPGGVNLNRNWPQKWPEFDPEAGWSPAIEPETRPLIKFLFDHPEIGIVWTFSLNDTLTNEPSKPSSTVDDADLPVFVELSRRYGHALAEAAKAGPALAAFDATESPAAAANGAALPLVAQNTPAPSGEFPLVTSSDGSLSEWAYQQLGAVAFATRGWTGPEIPDPAEGKPKLPTDSEQRWLYWNDHVVGGLAFVPFHAADHPTLGPVHVGGWKPGVRVNPPAERLETLVNGHTAFLKDLGSLVPHLEVSQVKVENKGDGLFEISAVASNAGILPTHLQQSIKAAERLPVIVRLTAPRGLLLSGQPLIRIDGLAGGGGARGFKWLIQAPADLRSVDLEVSTPHAGTVRQSIPLR